MLLRLERIRYRDMSAVSFYIPSNIRTHVLDIELDVAALLNSTQEICGNRRTHYWRSNSEYKLDIL